MDPAAALQAHVLEPVRDREEQQRPGRPGRQLQQAPETARCCSELLWSSPSCVYRQPPRNSSKSLHRWSVPRFAALSRRSNRPAVNRVETQRMERGSRRKFRSQCSPCPRGSTALHHIHHLWRTGRYPWLHLQIQASVASAMEAMEARAHHLQRPERSSRRCLRSEWHRLGPPEPFSHICDVHTDLAGHRLSRLSHVRSLMGYSLYLYVLRGPAIQIT